MKLAVIISSPPMRQVFRGSDPRAVAIVVERALWPLLEAGLQSEVSVQCSDAETQLKLGEYFSTLIGQELAFRLQQADSGAESKSKNAKA